MEYRWIYNGLDWRLWQDDQAIFKVQKIHGEWCLFRNAGAGLTPGQSEVFARWAYSNLIDNPESEIPMPTKLVNKMMKAGLQLDRKAK